MLRSNGSDGSVANAVTATAYQQMGGTAHGAAFVRGNGPVVPINIDHEIWEVNGASSARDRSRIPTQRRPFGSKGPNGAIAYQHGAKPSREAFQRLRGTPLALINPDHLEQLQADNPGNAPY